jgi:hypothetical protein
MRVWLLAVVVLVIGLGVVVMVRDPAAAREQFGSGAAAGEAATQQIRRVVLESSLLPPEVGARQPARPHCDPQQPSFVYGFAALKLRIGPVMGEPLECERPVHANGDTHQRTSTGLAYYRKGSNIPTFTTGWDHWALTKEGLVYWAGDVVDPPGTAPTPTAPVP